MYSADMPTRKRKPTVPVRVLVTTHKKLRLIALKRKISLAQLIDELHSTIHGNVTR